MSSGEKMDEKQSAPRRKKVRDGIEAARVVELRPSSGTASSATGGKRNAPQSKDERFYHNNHGLWRRSFDPQKPDTQISGPVECLAETRDAEGNGWGLLLGWQDRDLEWHEEAFPRALFAGDCGELRSRLAHGGLTLPSGTAAKNAFSEWLSSVSTPERARSVDRVGWHEFGAAMAYVLPSQVFGTAQERVVLQRETPEPDLFGQEGTVDDWRAAIGKMCAGNSRLVLAASAAFAAPLLNLLGEDGGGFSFLGASRLGKSTALHVAASVCGGNSQMGAAAYIRSWRSTGNALESVALGSCDALLALDELGQLDPREAGDTAYMLANGSGKARANRSGGARNVARWRVLFLSTGERGLADMNREAGRSTKAGQEVRFVDVPADARAGSGLFEKLHHADSPGELADYLREQASRIYGAPYRAFLGSLTARMKDDGGRATRENLRTRMVEITDHYLMNWPDASGQVRSVARRFAIAALGGELATEFGLTGWDDDTAVELVAICFRDWLTARGSVGRREDEQAVEQLRDFLSKHGEGRFERWVDPKAVDIPQTEVEADPPGERFRTQQRAGWKRWEKSEDGKFGWRFYLTPDGMGEALSGLNARDAKRVLIERGFLVPGSDGKAARVISPPGYGKTVRAYAVVASIFGAHAGDSD